MKRVSKLLCLCTIPLFISIIIGEASADVHPGNRAINGRPELSFSVVSDVHLRAGKNDRGHPYHDYVAETKLVAALQDLHRINANADAFVIDGDLTVTGMQTDYDSLKKVLQKSPHPKNTLFAIGNHEFHSAFRNKRGLFSMKTFPNGVTKKQCIDLFLKNTGMPGVYYDKWIKGYHFIVLGSEPSGTTNIHTYDRAVLSLRQLQWLDERLRLSPSNKPVFVFLHQPIAHTVAGSSQNYIVHSDKLRQVLNKYPQVIFFSGHSHWTLKNQPRSMYRDKFTMFNVSSVRNPITPHVKLAGDSEGLYVQVYSHKVVVMARDFTHKLWIGQYTVINPTPRPVWTHSASHASTSNN